MQNRHCPKCQTAYRKEWAARLQAQLLPIEYYHVIFEKAYRDGALTFPGDWQAIASQTDFQQWLAPLAAIDWVVRVRSVWDRRGSGDVDAAAKTVDYLSRYANRVAISNGRLVAIEGDEVLFRYKDYRDGNQWKTKRMPGVEFIGRFLQHVFPQRLRHIRRFGFMGAARGGREA